MRNPTRFVGLDVHADTIAVALAEDGRDGEVRQLGIIPNRPEAVRKLVQKLGTKGLRVTALICSGTRPSSLLIQIVNRRSASSAVRAPSRRSL